MNVTAASGTNSSSVVATGTKQLGKDEFLKILLTQLRYQDPLEPMQDREFISQMAQFSALEQMTNVAKELAELRMMNSLGAAYSLLGANVTYKDASGNEAQGVVTSTELSDGVMKLKVGNDLVSLENIVRVSK